VLPLQVPCVAVRMSVVCWGCARCLPGAEWHDSLGGNAGVRSELRAWRGACPWAAGAGDQPRPHPRCCRAPGA
jgi:hypothetical protein